MMKKILKNMLVLMCMTGVVLVTGCGTGEKDGMVETVEDEIIVSTTSSEVENESTDKEENPMGEYYGKGDTFEYDGCKFTIDDIIMGLKPGNICAILVTIENNTDSTYWIGQAEFYADDIECEGAYSYDERLIEYKQNTGGKVSAGRIIKVCYVSYYPENYDSLEVDVKRGLTGEVLYRINLK